MPKTLKEVIEHLSEKLENAEPQRVQQAVLSLLDDELIKDKVFLNRLNEQYNKFSSPILGVPRSTSHVSRKRPGDINIKPIGHVDGFVSSLDAPPDISVLIKVYGVDQLPLALSRYPVAHLRKAVKQLHDRHGAMPSTKDGLISYLVSSSIKA